MYSRFTKTFDFCGSISRHFSWIAHEAWCCFSYARRCLYKNTRPWDPCEQAILHCAKRWLQPSDGVAFGQSLQVEFSWRACGMYSSLARPLHRLLLLDGWKRNICSILMKHNFREEKRCTHSLLLARCSSLGSRSSSAWSCQRLWLPRYSVCHSWWRILKIKSFQLHYWTSR